MEQLLELLEQVDVNLAAFLQDVDVLTPYGTKLRYPSDRPAATEDDAKEAVALAAKVRDAVLARFKNSRQ